MATCGETPPAMEAGAWAAIQASTVNRPAGTANVPPAAIMPMPTRNRKPRATLPTSPSPLVRRMPAACVAMQPCPPSDRRADRQSRRAASTRASSPGRAARSAGLAHGPPQGESVQPSHTATCDPQASTRLGAACHRTGFQPVCLSGSHVTPTEESPRVAWFTCNPYQAVLAETPPRTGRSSPEKACCSQSTIGEAM